MAVLSIFLNLGARGCGTAQAMAFRDVVTLARQADGLGYSGLYLTEHHSTSGGVVANPLIPLAAIATATNRLQFGPAVRNVSLVDTLTLIEEVRLLDAVSHGRVRRVGLGVGVSRAEREAVGRVRPAGAEVTAIAIKVRDGLRADALLPYTLRPRIPVSVAVSSALGAAAVAEVGLSIMTNPYFMTVTEHRRILHAFRRAACPQQSVFSHLIAVVANTDGEALDAGVPALRRYLEDHGGNLNASVEDLVREGRVAIGSVAAVRRQIARLEQDGVTEIGLNPLLGYAPARSVDATLALLVEGRSPPSANHQQLSAQEETVR